uniref:Putative LAGLIDADG homing endonuclease n=1 Tax=Sarcinofilum mucosum TaxID=141643 RepID=A0A1W6EGD0_SARMC|nr:putative LAGLIDADG homing endonuclease [Sarcinofilum mucosum]ARK14454.1 putative LAGLIDADG homing endonuclease [Sarcinofilum mucosum]
MPIYLHKKQNKLNPKPRTFTFPNRILCLREDLRKTYGKALTDFVQPIQEYDLCRTYGKVNRAATQGFKRQLWPQLCLVKGIQLQAKFNRRYFLNCKCNYYRTCYLTRSEKQTLSYGSSETTRKAPCFSTTDFYDYGHAAHVPLISESFLQWFIGFFEADGHFSCYTQKNVSGKVTTQRLKISISQKEKKIIETIAYTFGFGNVSSFQRNDVTYWRWTVESKKNVERIAYLFSGNLILPKQQIQFLNWIEQGQKKGMFKAPFNKNKLWLAKVGFDNAWLSGFIDGEGCFYAHFRLPKAERNQLKNSNYKTLLPPYKLDQKFTLTQANICNEDLVLKQISTLFKSEASLSYFKNKLTPTTYVRIELTCLNSQELLINYVNRYKLRTSKYICFRRWWRVYLRRKNGVHLSEKGFKRLYRLVKSINVARMENS